MPKTLYLLASGPSFAVFLGTLAGGQMRSGTAGPQTVALRQDADLTVGNLIC